MHVNMQFKDVLYARTDTRCNCGEKVNQRLKSNREGAQCWNRAETLLLVVATETCEEQLQR